MKKYSLTIGIPAFNLEKTISKTVLSITKQINEVKDLCDVEIFISDNCSSDNTPSIVKKLQQKYPEVISYYKQKENLGYSRNVKTIFDKAKQDYIWLCGDDLFLDGALLNFCKALKESETKFEGNLPSVILTKSISSSDVTKYTPVITNKDECSDSYLFYENIFTLRQDAKIPIITACFMSITIIEKKRWMDVLKDLNLEGDYLHTEAVWRITKTNPITIIDKLCILAQEASWSTSRTVEFQIHATISYLTVIKNVFGNFDMMRKIDKKRAKTHIFNAISNLYKEVKRPTEIISEIWA